MREYFSQCTFIHHKLEISWGNVTHKEAEGFLQKNLGLYVWYVSKSILEHCLQEFWLGLLALHLGLPNFIYNRSDFRKWASLLMT